MKRIQSPFVREEEIKDVVAYLREEYDDLVTEELKTSDGNIVGAQSLNNGNISAADTDFSSEDDKYEQAKEIVIQTGKTSISNLQVRLGTGYARSAKLINMLEQAGVIITVTDNAGKKVKAVAGQGNTTTSESVQLEQEADKILAQNETEETQKEEKSSSFFRF
jgi:S-DNA-T family DNA segregation ATPase FtsK/SpoIIIE